MASSSNTDVSLNTILHMITFKLSSTNYLLWRSQVLSIFAYQKLLPYIDGSACAPAAEILENNKPVSNPNFHTWQLDDLKAIVILHSSLSEEAFAEVLDLPSARSIWLALENAYSNTSVERVQNLKDQLRQMSKGLSSVNDFGRRFKHVCDQLAAVGHPVDDSDKLHWFLCGFGASFETFSTAVRTTKPTPSFRDLLAQAESHELFLRSIHGEPPTPPVAFNSQNTCSQSQPRGRGGRYRGSGYSGGRGRGRRLPQCQLCHDSGHYANKCPSLATFASQTPTIDDNLSKAFQAQCYVNPSYPDCLMDSGATDHMTSSPVNMKTQAPAPGDVKVTFGNGKTLPVTHIGHTTILPKLALKDVLVVPKLTNNLLFVSKLTTDNFVDVLFSHPHFYV